MKASADKSFSWLDANLPGAGQPNLCRQARMRALPFAFMSQDVYPGLGGGDLGGGRRLMGWTEVFAKENPSVKLSKLDQLEIQLGDAFGFEAALYSLHSGWDQCAVIAYRGSENLLNVSRLREVFKSWALTNASATFDFINKGGEALINTLTYPLGGGLFKLINPRQAPSTQYDLADLLVGSALAALGHRNIVLTGHSLGGGLAQYAALKHGLRCVAFNSAGTGLTRATPEEARLLVRIDTTGFGLNPLVTEYSDTLSHHYGVRYPIGKGGHGVDEIIRVLMTAPQSA